MVISAIINLLADLGIVPSWSSACASVGKARHHYCDDPAARSYLQNLRLRPLFLIDGKATKFHPADTNPSIGANLESTTPPVPNSETACQQGSH
eukprot:1619704-Amphidinium_carterae.2